MFGLSSVSWSTDLTESNPLHNSLQDFQDSVFSEEPGFYKLSLEADVIVAHVFPVSQSMHVSIVGGGGQLQMPSWTCTGSVPAFTVTTSATLTLRSVDLRGRPERPFYINIDGGQAALDGCLLAATAKLEVAGGGELTLAALELPEAVRRNSENLLAGSSSKLRYGCSANQPEPGFCVEVGGQAVTLLEHPEWGALVGEVTAAAR